MWNYLCSGFQAFLFFGLVLHLGVANPPVVSWESMESNFFLSFFFLFVTLHVENVSIPHSHYIVWLHIKVSWETFYLENFKGMGQMSSRFQRWSWQVWQWYFYILLITLFSPLRKLLGFYFKNYLKFHVEMGNNVSLLSSSELDTRCILTLSFWNHTESWLASVTNRILQKK